MQKVTFKNQYQMNVTGNLFVPNDLDRNAKNAAMVVGHPMGAVKEQSANLYATKLAERGFVTMSLDLSYWGESEGQPRNLVAPDVYTEDFSAAVDYLRTQSFVDTERIGALGVCGSGSFVISAAKIDPRIKAVATVSMYDMGGVNRNGLRGAMTPEMRQQALALAAQQRDVEFTGGDVEYVGGTPFELDDQSTAIDREFYDFYRTARGNSPDTTTQPTLSSNVRFMNFYPFEDIETISPRPMLFITGDQAHSREFSEQAYQLAAEPKQLVHRSRRRPRRPLRPHRPHPLRHVGHLLPDQLGHRRMTAASPDLMALVITLRRYAVAVNGASSLHLDSRCCCCWNQHCLVYACVYRDVGISAAESLRSRHGFQATNRHTVNVIKRRRHTGRMHT